ncbi:7546_t:CDS:2 [Diversispora eburnea]|uniref:7546_t:CDS:1 n=1 Tax=Diversispora eburnea TaxID=1213867 RepID=A0A9N8YTF5_9GLOM|nr:7546_t:CDS:2 [Diversispora eburnea]
MFMGISRRVLPLWDQFYVSNYAFAVLTKNQSRINNKIISSSYITPIIFNRIINYNKSTKSSTSAIEYKLTHPRKKVHPLPTYNLPIQTVEEAVTNILYNTPSPSPVPPKRHILNCLVQNEPGVLSRVSGILAARGFNIDSLVVASTEVNDLSRMTIVLRGHDDVIEQARRQLEDLVPVWAVLDYTQTSIIEQDSTIINEILPILPSTALRHKHAHLRALLDLCQLFGAKMVDVATDSVGIELTARPSKLDAFIKLVKPYGILEAARSGMMALPRTPILDRQDKKSSSEEKEEVDATMLPPG